MLLCALGYMCLFELVFLFSSDTYSGVELLGHMVVLFLAFGGTSILFSMVAAPIYIPTNNVGGFLLSPLSLQHLSVDILVIVNLTGVR